MIHETVYCDFKSMYPTVNALMGLWDFVIADGLEAYESTDATHAFLEAVTLDELQHPSTWRQLCTLVRIQPQKDLFPVRGTELSPSAGVL